jgi:hypothetical protein
VRKIFFLLLLFFSIYSSKVFPLFQPIPGLDSVDIKDTKVSPFDSKILSVASKNAIYKSKDNGNTFEKIAVFKDEEIRQIFYDSYLADKLYIVTSRHLYSLEEGIHKLFQSLDTEVIYSAEKHKGIFFVGTDQGLHYTSEDLLVWKKSKKINEPVYYIESGKDILYLAAAGGVYSFDENNNIKRLFVMRKQSEDEDEEENKNKITTRIIQTDLFNKNRLWLGTSKGLFISQDSGSSWRKLYIEGIDNLFINCLAQTNLQKDAIYLGTTKGFFAVNFERNRAKHIFEGLYSSDILGAEFNSQGEIYLSTSKGLFHSNYFTFSLEDNREQVISELEPSIREIQQAALRYNEVHPDKIKKWRDSLKYRALFPAVSLDFDKTITTALGSTYDRVQIGPQDWGVNLKWDVGDLVWNSYEDDVDTRSRLDTQLRLDILDEINRVYFERLRLKREVMVPSLPSEELLEKKLRLEELTATIDAYTGGYFSNRLEELNEN